MVSETVGIIGLGYVGLPLALDFCESGIRVIGFDIDEKKIEQLQKGSSYISYIPSKKIGEVTRSQAYFLRAKCGYLRKARLLSCHYRPRLF